MPLGRLLIERCLAHIVGVGVRSVSGGAMAREFACSVIGFGGETVDWLDLAVEHMIESE